MELSLVEFEEEDVVVVVEVVVEVEVGVEGVLVPLVVVVEELEVSVEEDIFVFWGVNWDMSFVLAAFGYVYRVDDDP